MAGTLGETEAGVHRETAGVDTGRKSRFDALREVLTNGR